MLFFVLCGALVFMILDHDGDHVVFVVGVDFEGC